MAPVGGVKIQSDKEECSARAYGANYQCLAEDCRKRMNNLDYGAKAVDQLARLIPIVFERRFPFGEYM